MKTYQLKIKTETKPNQTASPYLSIPHLEIQHHQFIVSSDF